MIWPEMEHLESERDQMPCINCGSDEWAGIDGDLIRCGTCRLVMAAEVPTDEVLAQLYQQEYFFGKEYSDYKADRPALEANFRRRLDELAPLFPAQARVLEIGCAYGYFLNLIKDDVAWHQGYDVSEDGVRYAVEELGVNAKHADFLLDEDIAAQSVDTVVMWDVVEHLRRPDAFIEKAARALRTGGHLVLTTGDISALVARVRGARWRMIHPPTHLYYFAPANLTDLLARYGLQVQKVSHPGISRNVGSAVNQILVNRRAGGGRARVTEYVEKAVRRSGLGRVNLSLNLRDIMEVVAVKVPTAAQ
jgi:2-polyprenyl-3-methyl-5-hydroxy-6-metoxy-1,4-benzoquinol methylase